MTKSNAISEISCELANRPSEQINICSKIEQINIRSYANHPTEYSKSFDLFDD